MKSVVVLFTTFDALASIDRLALVDRLLLSVNSARKENGLTIKHVILVQRSQITSPEIREPHTVYLHIPGRASLSYARNIMLDYANANNLLDDALFVAFPDDDAWYTENWLKFLAVQFSTNPKLGLFFSRYCSTPELVEGVRSQGGSSSHPSVFQTVCHAQSNTMFVRGSIAKLVGRFDEAIGLGAPINGGEDLDYALRAHVICTQTGLKSEWFDAPIVGHRDKVIAHRARYYPGSLFALSRSGRKSILIFAQVLRKILVGLYLVLKRELTVRDYMQGTLTGLRGFVSNPVSLSPANVWSTKGD